MFSFQQSDELVFHEIPCSISFKQPATNQEEDLLVELHDHVKMENNPNISVNKARKLQGDQSPSSKPNSNSITTDADCKDEHTQRKLVHREIERQRRQDMAKLYASLRSLLPLEFVKGKRSTSDHMHQAVNYIKHMQERVKVLSVKRDGVKKEVETSVHGSMKNSNEKSLMDSVPNTVSISSCKGGIQILINSCSIEGGFSLSAVLEAISEEGLHIVTCTSTKVNERLLHSIAIQSEANDQVLMDPWMLQQRLMAVANDYN